jgi:hypothetical protein
MEGSASFVDLVREKDLRKQETFSEIEGFGPRLSEWFNVYRASRCANGRRSSAFLKIVSVFLERWWDKVKLGRGTFQTLTYETSSQFREDVEGMLDGMRPEFRDCFEEAREELG